MKTKDQQLLEEAYNEVVSKDGKVTHQLRHFKILHDVDLVHQVASLDGIEVEPDYEADNETYSSATASINTSAFPKTYQTLMQLVKAGKIKEVGGPTSVNMTGKAYSVTP